MKKKTKKVCNYILLIYFAVVLVCQLIFFLPITIFKIGNGMIGMQEATLSLLFQSLVFVALLFGVAQSFENYRK